MTREQAVKLIGNPEKLRKFLGLKTVQGVYMMPPKLPMPAKHILRMQEYRRK